MQKAENIYIKGARANNLKNIDVEIPRNRFVVLTGVSGSGKSSLAFDTLYAEGQRRYVESLSAYARQFLGRMSKPEVDYITGLPPAIAIEQKVNTRNPRSTVGTSTEIYDYLRMLFARVGHTFSPVTGKEVKKHTIDSILDEVLSLPQGTRIAVLADIFLPDGRDFNSQLSIYLKEGFTRLEKDGAFHDIAELLASGKPISPMGYHLLIDRLSVDDSRETRGRLADSIETAYYEGHDEAIIKAWENGDPREYRFSAKFTADGMEFREPSDLMFNFNNPYGACPTCEGFGRVMGISEDLVVPDRSRTLFGGAVQCWRGEKMSVWRDELINRSAELGFRPTVAYNDLTADEKDILWHGRGDWPGIDGFFRWVDGRQEKIQYRVMRARYRGKTICPDCHGRRLRPDAEYVKVGGKSITDITRMQIRDLRHFFDTLVLSETDALIARRLLREIRSRLGFLDDVGLGYLTLDRLSSTLSGGESQRINLATSLGSSLVGSLYVLDEPSIGLHTKDTDRLIGVLRRLTDIGNTVLVVEHDEEVMRASDWLIDIGPDAGSNGGRLIFAGDIHKKSNLNRKGSRTLDFLSGRTQIPVPEFRRPWKKSITVHGATANNLKNIDVTFPLGVITTVTGVSGSGKSTLVRDILFRAVSRALDVPQDIPASHHSISGDLAEVSAITFVDQNPIGTSTRSNPATYLKAYDEIRRLFADQQLSKQMGFTPGYFSFNSDGGRCEECKGEGVINISMQFMADIAVTCDACHGKRFKPEILEVTYRGKNIDDVLNMTVDDAISFFSETPGTVERRIVSRLRPLSDVGLGYIKLGQSSSTLSGGENQRVKLAYFLQSETPGHKIFIFDEPTTGLHFSDISTLLKSLNALVDKGNTVLIIEHNMDMIKSSDWVIDLGPGGGDEGGELVGAGTPEQIAAMPSSATGKYLAGKLR